MIFNQVKLPFWLIRYLQPYKFTCYKCNLKKDCPFKYDLYNLDGDCILEK